MRIEQIDVYRVSMTLVYPFRTAYGADDAVESVLVRMCSGEHAGWGEGSPLKLPAYSPESAAGVFVTIREFLAPLLIGKELASASDLYRELSWIKGNYFAKSAMEMAWWDLHARQEGKPLWQMLGGRQPEVRVGADFGVMDTFDELLGKIDEAVKAGFERVKLKFRPGWDLPMLDAVRGAFPKLVMHIDCNSAYTLTDLPTLKKLDRYGLAMIEQPLAFDDLIDHAELQRQIETPVCLDESITSVDRARKAIQIKACQWVNLKPGRVGGLTQAVAIHDLCRDAGVPCWVGGMLESAIGQSHALALATLDNIRYPCDIFPSSRFYKVDLARPEIVLSSPSRITAAAAPGIGGVPDEQHLKQVTVEKAIFIQRTV